MLSHASRLFAPCFSDFSRRCSIGWRAGPHGRSQGLHDRLGLRHRRTSASFLRTLQLEGTSISSGGTPSTADDGSGGAGGSVASGGGAVGSSCPKGITTGAGLAAGHCACAWARRWRCANFAVPPAVVPGPVPTPHHRHLRANPVCTDRGGLSQRGFRLRNGLHHHSCLPDVRRTRTATTPSLPSTTGGPAWPSSTPAARLPIARRRSTCQAVRGHVRAARLGPDGR